MSRPLTFLLLAFTALLAGCAVAGGSLVGAAAADPLPPDSGPPPGDVPAVEMAALIDHPEDYEGDYLRVAGNLRPEPPPACQTKRVGLQPSWRLSSADRAIALTGADEILRRPALSGLDAIAEGRWLRWRGPAGCGRQLEARTIWFLSVRRVAAPNPVAYVPVARDGAALLEGTPPAQDGPAGPPTATPVAVPATATRPAATATTTAGAPATVPTIAAPTATRPGASATVTAGAAGTGYPAPAESPVPLTATATPAGAETATPGGEPAIVDRPALEIDSLEGGRLEANEAHRWPLVITTTQVLTVSVAAELGMDVAVAVRDAAGNDLAVQNDAPAGMPEILTGVALPAAGAYDIIVSAPAGGEGAYALLALDGDSYAFLFQQTLAYDQEAAGDLAANSDHFWHFYGHTGDVVTIAVAPQDDADLFMRFFDEQGDVVVNLRNEAGPGEPEELAAVVLTADGLYSVLIGELNFGPAAYQIFISPGA